MPLKLLRILSMEGTPPRYASVDKFVADHMHVPDIVRLADAVAIGRIGALAVSGVHPFSIECVDPVLVSIAEIVFPEGKETEEIHMVERYEAIERALLAVGIGVSTGKRNYTLSNDSNDYIDVLAPDGKVIASVLRGGGFESEVENAKNEAASLKTAQRIAELLTLHGE